MDQIAMSGMNLNYPEAGVTSSTCSCRESRDDLLNAVRRKGLRHGIVIGEGDGTRGHDLFPTSFRFRNLSLPFPWPVRTGLASGVRYLHPCGTALFMNKADDSSERFNVLITPNAKVLRTNATLGT